MSLELAETRHSPLGGSSAERWINCGGSVELLKRLDLPVTDEPDYRRDGTAAHEVAALCLNTGADAWEYIGDLEAVGIDADTRSEIVDAVQLYLDTVRPLIAQAEIVRVEQHFHRPEVHPDYFGTADLALYFPVEELCDITDYKNGQGVVVEVEGNAQLMYYAYGLLQEFPATRRFRLRIVQPRARGLEAVRVWEVSAEDVAHWAETVLVPAMNDKAMERQLDAGPWCRFCPAKLVCPLMTALFGAAAKHDPKQVVDIGDASLGRSYQYVQAVKFYIKALEDEVARRLNKGTVVDGTKLVAKKANRVWKDGALEVLNARLGNDVYTPPEIRSPAEIEKLGTDAAKLVAEWAYTPFTGVTVALEADRRPAIKIQDLGEKFAGAKPLEE